MKTSLQQIEAVLIEWKTLLPLSFAVEDVTKINSQKEREQLSLQEMAILETFRNEKRVVEWVAGRIAAKRAFSLFTAAQKSELSTPQILRKSSGAPYIEGYSSLSISISHSGECAVAVVSSCPLGIDLELLEERPQPFLKCYFSTEEQKWITSSTEITKATNILWTRKEAASKLYEKGGHLSFKKIPTLLKEAEKENLSYYSDTTTDYAISLAFHHTG